jgi:hypothetical protein
MSNLIPPDFPRETILGAVPGAQPKTLVREVNGRYVAGPTEEEVQQRYSLCADLVVQLSDYRDRKSREFADLDMQTLLRKIRAGVLRKDWSLSPAELNWIMGKLGWTGDPIGTGWEARHVLNVTASAASPKEKAPSSQAAEPARRIRTRIQAAEEALQERLAKMRREI